jgi:hypothetical protein
MVMVMVMVLVLAVRCVLTIEANWLVFKPFTYRKILV